MKNYLRLLATTKNNNASDITATTRIAEIYQHLKRSPNLSKEIVETLVREALQLKKISENEINSFLAEPMHLFCFPYAGGSKSLYDKWPSYFSRGINIQPIEYPGRGIRSREKLIPKLDLLLADLEKEILLKLSKGAPFAFFGHSLGAIIAFEMALLFKKKYNLEPTALFLSASPDPSTISSLFPMANLEDREFIQAIEELKGVPDYLIGTEEFKTFFLPILRNDFALLDGYRCHMQTLKCPFIVFGGNQDNKISMSDLRKWEAWSQIGTTFHELEGDHFFVHEPRKIIEKIEDFLCLIRS